MNYFDRVYKVTRDVTLGKEIKVEEYDIDFCNEEREHFLLIGEDGYLSKRVSSNNFDKVLYDEDKENNEFGSNLCVLVKDKDKVSFAKELLSDKSIQSNESVYYKYFYTTSSVKIYMDLFKLTVLDIIGDEIFLKGLYGNTFLGKKDKYILEKAILNKKSMYVSIVTNENKTGDMRELSNYLRDTLISYMEVKKSFIEKEIDMLKGIKY